jgi:hypothetical protein
MLLTSAQCAISSTAMALISLRQRSTASWPVSGRRLKAVYRYCAIAACSTSAASDSRYVSSFRCSMTIGDTAAHTASPRTTPFERELWG